MKRVLSFILSLLMLVTVVMATQFIAYADDSTTDGKIYIKADGVQYEVNKGDIYTYVYNLAYTDKINSFDAETHYDTKGLEFIPTLDEYGDNAIKVMFPVFGTVVSNLSAPGKLSYNYSSTTGVRFPVPVDGVYTDKNHVFVGQFKVVGDSGVYEINTKIETMGDVNKNILVYASERRPEFPFDTDTQVLTETMEQLPTVSPSEPTTSTETVPTVTIGDVDEDGIINIFDATEIQLYLAKYKDFTATQRIAADADRDGIINIFDATQIQLYLAKYITEL